MFSIKRKHISVNTTVKDKIQIVVIYGVIALAIILALLPLITLISASFSENALLDQGISIFPKGLTTEAYSFIFKYPGEMLESYMITIGVTLIGLVLNLVLILLIAYPLSDVEFKYRGIVSFLVYFTMLFSAGLIPTYIIIRNVLHLYDTLAILVIFPLCSPGHIFMARVFLQAVPKSLYESAKLDGAGHYTILFRIAVPVIKPGLATLGFQILMLYWNDAATALNYTDRVTPIALYLQRWESYIKYLEMIQTGQIVGGGVIDPNAEIPKTSVRFAMGVLTCAPLLILFGFFQDKFVRGLTEGAVKE